LFDQVLLGYETLLLLVDVVNNRTYLRVTSSVRNVGFEMSWFYSIVAERRVRWIQVKCESAK